MDEEQKKLAEELLFGTKKKPGFAKMLYFGIFDSHPIFPYPVISPEEKKQVDEFIDKLKAFVEKEIDPVSIDRNAKIPDSVIKGLADLGVLGMTIPKEYGGLGMSQYAYCRAVETISARCGATALFVNAHQSIGLKSLLLFGTEEQRQQYLTKLSKGEYLAAFSLTEPNAGSDASGVETRADFDPQKNVYRLNGRKQWTTNGSIAKVLTVMAKTEMDTPKGKEDKITAFLVTPDMPGFKVIAEALDKVGMRGSRTANLEFENLEVPAANILGQKGAGLKICLTALDFGRTTFGAACTGAAKFLVERAVDYSRTRYQFKRPLASFPLVKKKIAMMSALTYAMDASTYLTAGLVDNGTEDIMLEAAILKVFASDSLWQILYDTMQIFGGRSFFTDAPYERMMRDARLNMIGEGSNEVMRAFIGIVGMRDVGVELKTALDAFKNPVKDWGMIHLFCKDWLKKFQRPIVPVQSSLFQEEARQLGSAVRKFGFSVVRLLSRYRENILEQQLSLDRIATSAMAIYTMAAVLSKIDRDLAAVNQQAEFLGNDVEIAKVYCQYALQNIRSSLDTLFNNTDGDIEKLSDSITGEKPRSS